MAASIEERLTAIYDSVKGGAELPRDVYQRLQFLARVFRNVPVCEPAEACLLWLDAEGAVASVFVKREEIVVGRGRECQVVLASPRVSRRHCVLRWAAGPRLRLEVEDLGSSNGTWVNGVQVSARGKMALRDSDVIEVGGMAIAVAGDGNE